MAGWHAVGIDLGTTYSAVAHVDSTGHTSMIRSIEGDLLTPSIVLFDEDETLIGREARKARGSATQGLAECVKRDMGKPFFTHPINGEQLPPEVIQACILRKLRADAVDALGESIKVVITVPAFFDEPRRKATADAGEMAGLDVLNIVNEPTAAALAFGERLGYLTELGSPREEMRVLVYDLGGGTFDVTLIELKPGEIVTLATDGDVQLGGYDWDSRLIEYSAGQFQQQCQLDIRTDPAGLARLRGLVEEAKHTLTARSKASFQIDHQGRTAEVVITQEKFEELTEDLLERTAYTTRQVLSTTGLQWTDVSRVLLVGGSSRMPMVSKMIQRMTGIVPDRSVNPDEAVARGAAVFADYLLSVQGENAREAEFKVVDVNSHSLGIEGLNRETLRKENVVLIPRNTPLPRQVVRKFVTKEHGQRSVVVRVLEGESSTPDQCTTIGRAVIHNLPPGLPEGTRIDVIYRYASNGRLSVRARLPGTGDETAIDLQREQGLSGAGMHHWKEIIAGQGGFSVYRHAIASQSPSQMDASVPATRERAANSAPTGLHATSAAGSGSATTAAPAAPAAPQSPAASSGTLQAPQPAEPASPGSGVSPGGLTPLAPGSQAVAGPTPQGGLTPQSPRDALASQRAGSAAAGGAAAGGAAAGGAAGVGRGSAGGGAGTMGGPPGDPMAAPSGYGGTVGGSAADAGEEADQTAEPPGSSMADWKSDLIGYVAASTICLVIGYYILCLVNPQANFLELPLPGVRLPQQEESQPPQQPPGSPPPVTLAKRASYDTATGTIL